MFSVGLRHEKLCTSNFFFLLLTKITDLVIATSVLPSVLSAVAEEFDHIGQEEASHFHQLSTRGRAFKQRSHDLKNH